MNQAWADLAESAISSFNSIDNGELPPFSYSYIACAHANLYGWSDITPGTLLDKLWNERIQNADGTLKGWSTTHQGSTIYTITIADHVGPAFVEAYASGMTNVSESQILEIAKILMAAPKNNTATGNTGWGISYLPYSTNSTSVYNINAATALILERMRSAGISVPPITPNGTSVDTLTMQLDRSVGSTYIPANHNWPYSSINSSGNDADHLSLLVEACMTIQPPMGRHAGVHLMKTVYTGSAEAHSPLAHMRVGGLEIGYPYADNWLTEAQTYYSAYSTDPIRLGQIARWASRIYDFGA